MAHEELLNEHQRRHLATTLHLLLTHLEELRDLPGVTPEVREAIQGTSARARAVIDSLSLRTPRIPDTMKRIRVAAEVWAMRTEELRADRLQAYGGVHPALSGRLDPLVDDLRRSLKTLAGEAADDHHHG